MPAEPPIIEVRNLSKVFSAGGPGGKTVAVDQVSFRLTNEPPRIVNLVGESGSGKSTVARTILGLAPPSAGAVLYRGQDVYRLRGAAFDAYRREVQAVFQDPYGIFNPFYRIDTVFQMVLRNFRLAPNWAQGRPLVEEALRAVDLRPDDVLGRYPHQLSGGERQRVMLARTYMLRPKLIIADEAISMLDAAVRALFLNILLDFKAHHGISTLFITHDLSTAHYLGGEVMVMLRGRMVERGPVARTLREPAHPYSQLLLQSIPDPDPDRRWQERLSDRQAEHGGPTPAVAQLLQRRRGRRYCVFADRCPHVMEVCVERQPPPFPIGAEHDAACFLYQDQAPAGVRSGWAEKQAR